MLVRKDVSRLFLIFKQQIVNAPIIPVSKSPEKHTQHAGRSPQNWRQISVLNCLGRLYLEWPFYESSFQLSKCRKLRQKSRNRYVTNYFLNITWFWFIQHWHRRLATIFLCEVASSNKYPLMSHNFLGMPL